MPCLPVTYQVSLIRIWYRDTLASSLNPVLTLGMILVIFYLLGNRIGIKKIIFYASPVPNLFFNFDHYA